MAEYAEGYGTMEWSAVVPVCLYPEGVSLKMNPAGLLTCSRPTPSRPKDSGLECEPCNETYSYGYSP